MKIKVAELWENKKLIFGMSLVFLMSLLHNFFSPYTTDDFTYMYSFADGSRITSILQIFPSLWEHYLTAIGRIVPHFFAQLFFMWPKGVFNLVNSLVYLGIVAMIYQITSRKRPFRLLIWLAIPVMMWIFLPSYGQIFLWMDGSFNYAWSYLFAFLFFWSYGQLFLEPEKEWSKGKLVWLCILGLFFGAYSENVSFAVISTCFVLICLVMRGQKSIRRYLCCVIPIITGGMGYLTLLLSPGEASHMGVLTPGAIVKNLIQVFTSYFLAGRMLLCIWAVLLVIAVYLKLDKKEIVLALVYVWISIVAAAVLCAGSYFTQRSLSGSLIFLVLADIHLMQALRGNSRSECIGYCIAAYFLMNSLLSLWTGTYDIYDTYQRNASRENEILLQIEAGNTTVTVPVIEGATPYSCKTGLTDLRTAEEDTTWPNGAIAKYYGLDAIYGARQE